MKFTKIIITLALITGLSAIANAHCGSCASDNHAPKEHKHHEAAADHNVLAFAPLYLGVQEALADDDFDTAKAKAQALHSSVKKSGHSDHLKIITKAAAEIASAQSITQARKAFQALSNDMIAKMHGIADQELYVAYCPMAFNNTGGQWLQKDKTVNNPYFGAQMLRCGMIKKTVGRTE